MGKADDNKEIPQGYTNMPWEAGKNKEIPQRVYHYALESGR